MIDTRHINIQHMVASLYQEADARKFNPLDLKPPAPANRRDFRIEGHRIRVQFTRTCFSSVEIYQLSINSPDDDLPEELVAKLTQAFFPDKEIIEFPSMLGNCRQFMVEI